MNRYEASEIFHTVRNMQSGTGIDYLLGQFEKELATARIADELSICDSCFCMSHTVFFCGKCHQRKFIGGKAISKLEDKNPNWKGDVVGLKALHEWVKRRKIKTKFCEKCLKAPPRDLANISQEYRRDLNDFEWLCRKCHMEKDGRLSDLKKWPQAKKTDFCLRGHKKTKIKNRTCCRICSKHAAKKYRQRRKNNGIRSGKARQPPIPVPSTA